MCIVCGPGGTRLLRSIAGGNAPAKMGGRSRFVAEGIAPAITPPLNPADLEELKGPADVILHGGPILTMRNRDEVAPAIAVRAGRIQGVGDEESVFALRGRLTRIIDLDGRSLLPGFVVADWHPPVSLLCDWLDARKAQPATIAAAIAERSNEWLALLMDRSADCPIKPAIAATGSRPIIMVDRTGSVLAASAAARASVPELESAQFDEASPHARPHISVILPTLLGCLAGSLDRLRARLSTLFSEAARHGVTTLRFCGLGALAGHNNDPDLVRSAAGESSPLRFRGAVDASLALHSEPARSWPRFGDDMFRIDTAVHWIDAASTELRELAEMVRALREKGWRVTLHAESLAAIDLALDAFSAATRSGTSFDVADSIECRAAQSAGAWARIRRLGISAGIILDDPVVSEDGAPDFDALPGVPVSLTRDLIAGAPEPLVVLRAAANAAASTGVTDWLPSVTADAAARCGAGPIFGSFEVGKYADFAFLDRDPRGANLRGGTQTQCIGTWLAGREIRP